MRTTTLAKVGLAPGTGHPLAACTKSDPELFFPDGKGATVQKATTQAKKVCDGCSLLTPCQLRAIPITDLYGVWGGTTKGEREQLRAQVRERRAAA